MSSKYHISLTWKCTQHVKFLIVKRNVKEMPQALELENLHMSHVLGLGKFA